MRWSGAATRPRRWQPLAWSLVVACVCGCGTPTQGGASSDSADAVQADSGPSFDAGDGAVDIIADGSDAVGDGGAGGDGADGADSGGVGSDVASDGDAVDDGDSHGGGADSDDGAGADAALDADVAASDSGIADADADTDADADADADAGDGAAVPSACQTFVCGQVTFTCTPPAGTATVKLAGTMNAWKLDLAPELLDADGDGTFAVTTTLSPGTYQYKFVADGAWLADGANPLAVDDGFGGKNSVIIVPSCLGPLALQDHSADVAKATFSATFAVAQGPVSLADLLVTVDWKPVPVGALSWVTPGQTLSLTLAGLAKGIHDVRVGCGAHSQLLKVAIGAPTDWRDTVLYFAMTDRFVNGNPANDAPHPDLPAAVNWQGGDFVGISNKIAAGYFDKLGVGALWISWPVLQPSAPEPGGRPDAAGCGLDPKKIPYAPLSYSGYHGYWPASDAAIEPRFGTLAELQNLVTAAHAKGIRVLLDFTANHVHTSAPWFGQHKDHGWFHLPAKVCGDIGWDVAPIECWFTSYLADFDHDGPSRTALLDAALAWVHKTGVDGFRVDAVKHVEVSFVEDLRRRVHDELELTGFPFWLVGETFTGDAGAIKAYVSPTRLHGQFDFAGNYAVLEAFAKGYKGLDGLDAAWRAHHAVYGAEALMSTFLGNHDIARFLSLASGGVPCGIWDIVSNQAAGWKNPPGPSADAKPYEMLRLAFAWLYVTPGIPLIYYGDEIGMPGAGDPDNRRMMRFDSQLTDHESATLQFLQALGQARAGHPALRKGSWAEPLWKEANFIAFARTLGEDRVVVLLHRGDGVKAGTIDVSAVGWPDGQQLVDALTGADLGSVQAGKLAFSVPTRTVRLAVAK